MTFGLHRLHPKALVFCAAVLTLGSLSGCSRGVGDASGRITFKGKPVVCGSVTFVGPDGMTKTGRIGPDGSYTVSGIGAGRVQVAVMSDDPARPLDPYKAAKTHGKEVVEPIDDSGRDPNAGRVMPSAPSDKSNWAEPDVDRSKWFPLPKKYELVGTSELTVELKAGSNTGVDIDLQ